MADSEDEYERRRRDKFRRERSDFQERRETRTREEWEERSRDNWKGRVRKEPFRDFDRRERFPPAHLDREYSPQPHSHIKRLRREWDDPAYYHVPPINQHYHQIPPHYHYEIPNSSVPPLIPSLSVNYKNETNDIDHLGMLSFKDFLLQQDDNIDPEQAIKKYKEYKTQYQKTMIYDFFQAHKDEEWLKNKYHPDDSVKANLEKEIKVKNRLKIFMDFYNKGFIEKFSLDQDQLKEIVKFLDAVIIKLEGGSDNDIKYLDEEYASAVVLTEEVNIIGDKTRLDDFDPEVMEINEQKANIDKQDGNAKPSKSSKTKDKITSGDGHESDASVSSKSSSFSGSSANSSSSHTSTSSRTSHASSNASNKKVKAEEKDMNKGIEDVKDDSLTKATNGDKSPIEEGETNDDSTVKQTPNLGKKNHIDKSTPETLVSYHRTSSIFLRNLPPNVTRAEVENLCKNYPGYLRVALADPLPERKFYRRGWITFNRDANVKDICTSLSSMKIKECDMGPIVNRDIIRRVRLVNGIVCHKPIVTKDITLACRTIVYLDSKFNLWTENSIPETDNDENVNLGESTHISLNHKLATSAHKDAEEMIIKLGSIIEKLYMEDDNDKSALENWTNPQFKNPLLKNIITDFLALIKADQSVDGSQEVEPQLEKDNVLEEGEERGDEKHAPSKVSETEGKVVAPVKREEKLNKLLDKLILYLRIVHSMDYYSISEYPNEDDMPNKCGIIHCRGALSQTKLFSKDVNDWIKNFEVKIKTFISPPNALTDQQATELGLKTYETEIEMFIQTNSQELAKDKWLCPLSGKKFKGSDFVRKHIFNKHPEKINEVKKEVDYFNNYLLDVRRPHNLIPSVSAVANASINTNKGSAILKNVGQHHYQHHGPNYNLNHSVLGSTYPDYQSRNYYQPPYPMRGTNDYERNMFPKKRISGGSREIIQYKDLDAPEENELF